MSPTIRRSADRPRRCVDRRVRNVTITGRRFTAHTGRLKRLFSLVPTSAEATAIRDDVAFFDAVRQSIAKIEAVDRDSDGEPALDTAVRQIISEYMTGSGVIDIFAEAGLEKPDISILSDGFLDEVRGLPHKNLAVELLRKLLNDEIGGRGKANVAQSRLFSERLQEALGRYRNRSVGTAQVIEELLALARDMRDAQGRGEKLGLSDDEVAFYDALGGADMASVMGDEALRTIAREVAKTVRANTKIDWSVRESVRADMRRSVRRVLRRVGYPPERTEDATELVVKQAEQLTADYAP